MNVTLKKFSALLAVVAVINVAGCADRNKDNVPESPATPGEVDKAVDKAGDAVGNTVDAAGAAAKTPVIKSALAGNPSLKGSNIDVDSKETGITLSGTVKNEAQKKVAGEIAKKNAPGYTINNNLKVAGGASPMMNKGAKKN